MPKDFSEQNRRQGEEMLNTLVSLRCHPRRQREGQYLAHCPFHDDHTPSFSLKTTDGVFHCFGCGVKGTYWVFCSALRMKGYDASALHMSRASTQRARRMVARCDALPCLPVDAEDVRSCHNFILQYWHEKLLGTPEYAELVMNDLHHSFIRKVYQRDHDVQEEHYSYESPRFDQRVIEQFCIGFAPASSQELRTLLEDEGMSRDTILATGLFRKHGNNGLISPMSGRVVYPYFRDGKTEYAIGRITIFTPENLAHSKYCRQRTCTDRFALPMQCPPVFNFDALFASDAALLIAEGITDAVKAVEVGIPAISLGTTAFQKKSLDQVTGLLRDKVAIVCFDAEENGSGSKGAQRVVEDLSSRGVHVCNVHLPMPRTKGAKTDVCSYILESGATSFHQLIEDQTGITFRSSPDRTTLSISSFLLGRSTLANLNAIECETVILRHIFA